MSVRSSRTRTIPEVFVAIALPAAVFSVLLRVRHATWGREGRYVDLWSIPHFLVGVVACLLGLELVHIAAIAIVWELVELAAHVREYPANRVIDVVLAVAGWSVTRVALA